MEYPYYPSEIHVGGRQHLSPKEIVFLESSSNYTLLFCCDGKRFIVATTLGHIEERLSDLGTFLRVNRGTLVNFAYVNGICHIKKKYIVTMINGKQFTVSRRRVLELKIRFPQFNS